MAFQGWPAEGIAFYRGLEADNSKTYWQANKHVYERSVAGPMRDLLDELEEEFGEAKIYRPYRDVRFSKDKSPYKTACSAPLWGGGYVQYSANGLGVGAGYYLLDPPQLDAFRSAILDDATGTTLESIVHDVRAAGAAVRSHDTLKSAPRGVAKDHPRIELLRHKGLVCWWEFEAGPWLSTPAAKDRVVESLRLGQPLLDWLDDNVGR